MIKVDEVFIFFLDRCDLKRRVYEKRGKKKSGGERKDMTVVVAFDMGVKNFAFAQMEISNHHHDGEPCFGHVLSIDSYNLSADGGNIFRELISYLDSHSEKWEMTDVVLIEQQMNMLNISASRLACHVAAYFYHRFPSLYVSEYPSTIKTQCLGADKRLNHKGRKKFAIDTILSHYKETDPVLIDWISSLRKRDDVADCILMCATFPLSKIYHMYHHQTHKDRQTQDTRNAVKDNHNHVVHHDPIEYPAECPDRLDRNHPDRDV